MTEKFTADPKVQQVAEAYAADAVDFARERFQLTLDGSDASMAHVETILGALHERMPDAKPSADEVFTLAKMFGSYVGETFRRNHGATWGLVRLDDETFVGMKNHEVPGLFWPWGRAQKRLKNGPEDNMLHYYRWLVEKRHGGAAATPAAAAATTPKTSWWKRLWQR